MNTEDKSKFGSVGWGFDAENDKSAAAEYIYDVATGTLQVNLATKDLGGRISGKGRTKIEGLKPEEAIDFAERLDAALRTHTQTNLQRVAEVYRDADLQTPTEHIGYNEGAAQRTLQKCKLAALNSYAQVREQQRGVGIDDMLRELGAAGYKAENKTYKTAIKMGEEDLPYDRMGVEIAKGLVLEQTFDDWRLIGVNAQGQGRVLWQSAEGRPMSAQQMVAEMIMADGLPFLREAERNYLAAANLSAAALAAGQGLKYSVYDEAQKQLAGTEAERGVLTRRTDAGIERGKPTVLSSVEAPKAEVYQPHRTEIARFARMP